MMESVLRLAKSKPKLVLVMWNQSLEVQTVEGIVILHCEMSFCLRAVDNKELQKSFGIVNLMGLMYTKMI